MPPCGICPAAAGIPIFPACAESGQGLQGFVAVVVHVDLLGDTAKPEFTGNHKSIHIVVLWQVRVGFLELADLFGVKHMDFALEPAQGAIFPESVHKIISVDSSGFHADNDLLQTHRGECRHNFIYEYFSTPTVVLYSEIAVLFPIRPHEIGCVSTASHINANE